MTITYSFFHGRKQIPLHCSYTKALHDVARSIFGDNSESAEIVDNFVDTVDKGAYFSLKNEILTDQIDLHS